jgi:CheY-like chemotaxis protein
MSPTDIDSPPVILVVEDDDYALRLRTDAFADAACTAIGVTSKADALRELRAAPGVDLVISDIHLLARPGDKSGVALAREVKERHSDLPVVGYSAVFGDDQLAGEAHVFDRVWAKGDVDPEAFDEMIAFCRARAREHRSRRQERVLEAHTRLRREHESAHPAVELMRQLQIGSHSSTSVEDALSKAGYRLKLVECEATGFSQPIIVWLLDLDGGVEAEVYGQPELYGYGGTDEEALATIVDLMRWFAADVGPDAPDAVGPALGFTDFLRRVVGRGSDG